MSWDSGVPPGLSTRADAEFPYEIVGQAGVGASSTVWLAMLRSSGAKVALKVGRSLAERTRLANEASKLCLLDSPSLCAVAGAGFVPQSLKPQYPALAGAPYVALQWCEGQPLSVQGTRDHRAAVELALAVARDVGEAIDALHSAGLSHGDVKPANVMVERGEGAHSTHAVLVDLGMGDALSAEPVLMGTPHYLPPEAFENSGASTARTRDLWAFGRLLAEILEPNLLNQRQVPQDRIASLNCPKELQALIAALLSPNPALRPSAHWMSRTARALLHQPHSAAELSALWEGAVRRSYIATRQTELAKAALSESPIVDVKGVAGDWLRHALQQLSAIADLRRGQAARSTGSMVLSDLSSFEQRRWLVRLIGGNAVHFPALPWRADSALATVLLTCVKARDPRSLSFNDLTRTDSIAPPVAPEDPVLIAAQLAASNASWDAIEAAQRALEGGLASAPLKMVLAQALCRRGDWAVALSLFDEMGNDAALAEGAEICRRLGDVEGAQRRLQRLTSDALPAAIQGRARATAARLALDHNGDESAIAALQQAPEVEPVREVKALIALHSQRYQEAIAHGTAALQLATTNEEAARALSIVGSAHHGAGEASLALESYRPAADSAARAGALVEEATYSANVAAAAADLGDLSICREYAERALLLFEHLGRATESARVALTLLCAHATVGAVAEASYWFDEVRSRLRLHKDDRCLGYAHLAMADLLGPTHADCVEHAQRAATLLAHGSADDQLRAAGHLVRCDRPLAHAQYDDQARSPAVTAPAKLAWWAARAANPIELPAAQAGQILAEFTALAPLPLAPTCAGSPFAEAARLAARLGEGDLVRRFTQIGTDALRQIERGTPAEFRTLLAQLPWVQQLRQPQQTPLSREQIGHLENLIRSLSTRDRLRPLLDQVLDALVLWTGVERGLVLLRAPGGRLLPRAARNLARRDLVGEQLKLSQSLAERALHSAEPVVAIDATGEMSDLHQSVHSLGLRSVLAVPLIARGEALGVVYLDDRTRRGAFGAGELSWVKLVGALAALAIADARDQALLRRAARRARHAEERVLGLLATREAQVAVLQQELARESDRGTRFPYDNIVGQSSPLRDMLKVVDRVAAADISVMVLGESGSGKELIARAIHDNSARRGAAFVSENCSAIPETLLESTLFGHVKGAFTGASRQHAGLFEMAHQGTLFLDEVGEMSLGMQTKLLRALETGEIRPVGSERTRKVDVRVIVATHQDLQQMLAAGKFREDLFYRLNVVQVKVPALRERPEDIELLIRHFCRRHGNGRMLTFTPAAILTLRAHSWPGNVRELINEVRRLLIMTEGEVDQEHLAPAIAGPGRAGKPTHDLDLRASVDALESALLHKALERTGGNQTRAAELLGVSRFGLQKMMKRLNIDSLRAGREAGAELTD
ncbi:MAG TPA: sigma 54-interacting transcriptional regulator [Polyangiaceae bacterium]|nr:sigma 54-interacting transcriptional regulator [Polyangiaceae bacterium]